MVSEKPYFMTDPSWWYYDEDAMICRLTDDAPAEAVASYEKYYADVNAIVHENGEAYIIDKM